MKTILSIYVAIIGCACVAISANATVRYVNVNNATPGTPYTDWATAANVIQDAIDVASAGDEIIVTNGVYQTGGAVVAGLSNRVAITRALTLRSINGPLVTIIRGEHPTNLSALRCVYLTNGAQLVGFTLTDGSTSRRGGDLRYPPLQGGGAWCESQNAVISNCVVIGNSAATGGGTWRGTLHNCELINNVGGGTSGWVGEGGGAASAVLNNCLVRGNISGIGGGASGSVLNNCTVVENYAWNAFTPFAGSGASSSALNNCVVYFNGNLPGSEHVDCLIRYSCTPLLPTDGVYNITNAPLFVDAIAGDFRLQANAPCINAGRNAYAPVGFDLNGHARIAGGTVDIGAYEFQSPESVLSYAWLRQYGLPTDGTVDSTDGDGDGMDTLQEWRAGTDPFDAQSVLRLLRPAGLLGELLVSWQSVSNRTYFLERSTHLTEHRFGTVASNIFGQPGATVYADTNMPPAGQSFYRVGVEE